MLLPSIPAAAASLRVANAGVSKPSLPRHMQFAGPQIPLFRQPAPAFPAAAAFVPRSLEAQASMAASVSGAHAASKQPSGEQVPSFTPRHSRKKVCCALLFLNYSHVSAVIVMTLHDL